MARILIIDDDSAVCDYLATLVTRLGHQPVQAATCAEGLAGMADPTIEIIIADIYLPDGPDLEEWVSQLKTNAAGRPLTATLAGAALGLAPAAGRRFGGRLLWLLLC